MMRTLSRREVSLLKCTHRLLSQQRHPPILPVFQCQRQRFLATASIPSNVKSDFLCVSDEVQEALITRKAVVALESTIITHGMPYPHNFSTALCVERRVRENGAIPATVAVINGKLCVGLSDTDIIWLAEKNNTLTKISRRDLASVISRGGSGGTTVSATMIAAHMAGIPIFATGGIGGVHRGAETSFDVSADLTELGRTPVAVVSSGVKSILDIPKTLEYLETQGVLVASFSDSKQFPAFFTRDSGYQAPYNVASHLEAAKIIASQEGLGLQSGMLFAVPIPHEISPAGQAIENAISEALTLASEKNISGREVTPFVLGTVNQLTKGESLVANIALVENNASVAGGIANCLAQLRAGVAQADVQPPTHTSSFSILKPAPSPALASAISSSTGGGKFARAQDPGYVSDDSSTSSDEDTEDRKSPKTKGRPVVLGATIVDLTVKVDHDDFKMNGVTYQGKISQSFGGVGRNLADCLSRLDLNPVFVSAVGRDTDLNACSHMDLSMVQCLDDQSTATYCATLAPNGHLHFGVGDMDINSSFDIDTVDNLDKVIMSAPIVMMDGNFSPEAIESIVKKCALYKVPVWFEPTDLHKAGKPFVTNAWRSLTGVSPNVNELVAMHAALMVTLGRPVEGDQTLYESADVEDWIHNCVRMCEDLVPHIPVVLVTLGRHGLLLCHDQGSGAEYLLPSQGTSSSSPGGSRFHAVHYPTLGDSRDIASVSGAGDCLVASFVAAMLEGHPLEKCVRLSLGAADLSLASSAAVPGTISHNAVLGKEAQSQDKASHWRPRILKTC